MRPKKAVTSGHLSQRCCAIKSHFICSTYIVHFPARVASFVVGDVSSNSRCLQMVKRILIFMNF